MDFFNFVPRPSPEVYRLFTEIATGLTVKVGTACVERIFREFTFVVANGRVLKVGRNLRIVEKETADVDLPFIGSKLGSVIPLGSFWPSQRVKSFLDKNKSYYIYDEVDLSTGQIAKNVGCAILYPIKEQRAISLAGGESTAKDILADDIASTKQKYVEFILGLHGRALG